MAAPVAHIVLALLMLKGPFAEKDKEAFLAGTVFPDIRYIAGLSREETHKPNVTLEDIKKEPSSFKAGMYLHALVDKIWWDYMRDDVHKLQKENQRADIILKFFEGTLLRDRIDDFPAIEAALDKIWNEERAFGIPDEIIKGWHEFIKMCFSKKLPPVGKIAAFYAITLVQSRFVKLPSLIRKLAVEGLSRLPLTTLFGVRQFINKIKDDEALKQKILYFYDNFETILEKYAASC